MAIQYIINNLEEIISSPNNVYCDSPARADEYMRMVRSMFTEFKHVEAATQLKDGLLNIYLYVNYHGNMRDYSEIFDNSYSVVEALYNNPNPHRDKLLSKKFIIRYLNNLNFLNEFFAEVDSSPTLYFMDGKNFITKPY